MTTSGKPPFRADHVGSLLRPPALKDAREKHDKGEVTRDRLRRLEDDCIRDAVTMQEEVGLAAITDGEFRRYGFHTPILTKIQGVELTGRVEFHFHYADEDIEYAPPVLEVTGKLGRPPEGLTVADFKFTRALTDRTVKVTIPSPTYMYARGGWAGINKRIYPDKEALIADLAKVYNAELHALWEAGCEFVQIDDTNFAHICDPKFHERYQRIGEDPATLPSFYARMINECIRHRPPGQVVGIHMCRGNVRGAWVAAGGYEHVAEALLGEMEVDCYFLEYDDERSGDFSPLRHLRGKNKIVVLGLVTTKKPQLEPKDTLKRRIDEAARYVPMSQLALSPQCGFASIYQGNPLTIEAERAKLSHVVTVAREVWGTAGAATP
jgi:5-methyltetrahydropteroyltriglutamate--homocysteine methyltransferase